MDDSFRKGKALFAVNLDGDKVIIDFSCHNSKLDSFWAGEWLSTYTIDQGVLSSVIKIKSHYFEMGNMMFNLDK